MSEVLKAELEDGYGRIANLLLEALSISKLNGKQMSICLFIIRRTYSWGEKSDQISLKEFSTACDSSESYMSKQLKQLIGWKVIKRNNYSPGKAPSYEINTRVDEWDKGCLNVQGLHESIKQGLYKRARVPLNKRTRVDTSEPIEIPISTDTSKEKFKESIKKDTTTTVDGEKNLVADIDADSIQQDKKPVAQVDADSTKQDSLSRIQNYYLAQVRQRATCSSMDLRSMIDTYEKYKDIDFILEVMEVATKENIKRNGKCKIKSFNYFEDIFEERWEERTKPKEVRSNERNTRNSKQNFKYDKSQFLWNGGE